MSATAAAGFVVGLAVGLVVGFCRLPLAIPNKVRIASRDDKEKIGRPKRGPD